MDVLLTALLFAVSFSGLLVVFSRAWGRRWYARALALVVAWPLSFWVIVDWRYYWPMATIFGLVATVAVALIFVFRARDERGAQ